jgi:hypothetical protein
VCDFSLLGLFDFVVVRALAVKGRRAILNTVFVRLHNTDLVHVALRQLVALSGAVDGRFLAVTAHVALRVARRARRIKHTRSLVRLLLLATMRTKRRTILRSTPSCDDDFFFFFFFFSVVWSEGQTFQKKKKTREIHTRLCRIDKSNHSNANQKGSDHR